MEHLLYPDSSAPITLTPFLKALLSISYWKSLPGTETPELPPLEIVSKPRKRGQNQETDV